MLVRNVFANSSARQSKYGRRYEAEWALECLMLCIKSRAAYEHLRDNLLPLPSPTRLRDMISYMPCCFGYSEFALTAIQEALKGKPLSDRLGSLIFDELCIAEDVDFNLQKLCVNGFVDYGEENVNIGENHPKVADHALLLVFRPYRSRWIQPIGLFATSGAAPGRVLHQLISKAIAVLETRNARVFSVVCDGAQSNKSMWGLFGISGKKNKVTHFINHPLVENEKVYFLLDVPHILKCIRNFIWNHKNVQVFTEI